MEPRITNSVDVFPQGDGNYRIAIDRVTTPIDTAGRSRWQQQTTERLLDIVVTTNVLAELASQAAFALASVARGDV